MIISIKLTSYSPVHPGKERGQKGKLNKRIFPYIPGTTVYGALIRTFLNFFCKLGKNGNFKQCKELPGEAKNSQCKDCFYSKLLIAIKNKTFRISPFLPDMERINSEKYDALFYSKLAQRSCKELITTLTRTSINTKGSVEEGHLYSLQVHNPFTNYYGFMRLPEELKSDIATLLKLLPLAPFGGKGTDAVIDGEIAGEYLVEDSFLSSLKTTRVIKSISPIPFLPGNNLYGMDAQNLIALSEKTQLYGRTYMEIKKNGLYLKSNGEFENYKNIFEAIPIIEGKFYLKEDINKGIFIYGAGNVNFNYLGFGQVIFV